MADNEVDRSKLHQICELSYKAQAVWFLNGFWDSHQGEAEKFWAYVHKANAIDIEKHEEGCALDELNAHRLLEMFRLLLRRKDELQVEASVSNMVDTSDSENNTDVLVP